MRAELCRRSKQQQSYDAHSAKTRADIQRAKDAVAANERLHRWTVTALVFGETKRALRINGAHLRTRLRPYIHFRPCWGEQQEGLKFFTTTPRTAIAVSVRDRPVLSSGAVIQKNLSNERKVVKNGGRPSAPGACSP